MSTLPALERVSAQDNGLSVERFEALEALNPRVMFVY